MTIAGNICPEKTEFVNVRPARSTGELKSSHLTRGIISICGGIENKTIS